MKVLVVADGHYYKAPDGHTYVESVFDYEFYKRYLEVFEDVKTIIRLSEINEIPTNMKRVDGLNLELLPLPNYTGAFQYLQNYFIVRALVKKYIKDVDCGIFRIPGATANVCCEYFKKTNKPFAIEVVVDPWEYFAKGTVSSKFRPLVRLLWTRKLKKLCLEANGVSYVTKEYLQKKYPCKALLLKNKTTKYFTGSYSSVELKENLFGDVKVFDKTVNHLKIVHVANAFTGYGKGHVVVMKALKYVIDRGYSADVCFVGDGPLRIKFEKIAFEMGISENVNFIGRLPGVEKVRAVMRESDLFVFPTMAEGLPRVLLEAMAEGLPCISSPVCGIPEILDSGYLIGYGDWEGYGKKIIELVENSDRLTMMSSTNLRMAKQFARGILQKQRNIFYKKLREIVCKERYRK